MGGGKEWGIANVVVAFGLRLCSSGVLINSYTLSAARWPLFVVSFFRKCDHPRDSPFPILSDQYGTIKGTRASKTESKTSVQVAISTRPDPPGWRVEN